MRNDITRKRCRNEVQRGLNANIPTYSFSFTLLSYFPALNVFSNFYLDNEKIRLDEISFEF